MFSQKPHLLESHEYVSRKEENFKIWILKAQNQRRAGRIKLLHQCFQFKTFKLTSFPAYFDVSDSESEAKGREFKRSEHLFPA